jgi:hypothetical protein
VNGLGPIRALAFAASLLLPAAPAWAVEPQECLIGDPARPYADVPEDLGGGLVLQRFVQGEGDEELNVSIVVFCPSSEQIEAITRQNGRVTGSHDAVTASVLAALVSSEQVTMADLRDRVEATGTPTSYQRAHGTERCGCAAFYPELRGDKTPWSGS